MTVMPGLMWLAGPRYAGRWPFCLTFVRGAGEDQVLAAFGADPGEPGIRATARSALATAGPPGLPLVLVRPADGWLAALEQNVPPYGTRPDVLRAASAGGEAVAVYQDIGKLNHEFVHAADGQIVSAVRTTVPPHWWGDDPGRLQPLAEELGLGGAADSDLTSLEVLLALAEGGFGLSLDEADLDQPWRAAPIRPRPDDPPASPPGTAVAGAAPGPRPARRPVAPAAPAAPAGAGRCRAGWRARAATARRRADPGRDRRTGRDDPRGRGPAGGRGAGSDTRGHGGPAAGHRRALTAPADAALRLGSVPGLGSVADGAFGGVGVLVVDLVVDPGRDVDDLRGGRGLRLRLRRLGGRGDALEHLRLLLRGVRLAALRGLIMLRGPRRAAPGGGRGPRRCGPPRGAATGTRPAAHRAAR